MLYYEDLIIDTEQTIHDLLKWIGVEWDSDILNYFKNKKNDSLTPKSELWQHSKTLEAPDRNRIDAFLKELSPAELKAVELTCFKDLKYLRKRVDINISLFQGVPLLLKAITKKMKNKLTV
ncbi:MAG TPA: hypothetical protein ENL02_01275 [Epsilonproteobacteria bacterium]|nr:hypothetical protein [Campylobacterota bacterium]